MFPKTTCIPCLKRLVRQTVNLATPDKKIQKAAYHKAVKIIQDNFLSVRNPARIASIYHRTIKKVTGNDDPFHSWKIKEIDHARKLFSRVEKKFSKDDLPSLLKLAVLGNSLDFFCTEEETAQSINSPVEFALDDSSILKNKLSKAKNILILADNAGEVFFDLPLYRFLLNNLKKKVTYVIKEKSVQNDITAKDIETSGLKKSFKQIITNEYDGVGFNPKMAGKKFKKIYLKKTDLIIAKGMGHLETLGSQNDPRLFFLLKAKCQPIARQLKVAKGSYVIRHSPNFKGG